MGGTVDSVGLSHPDRQHTQITAPELQRALCHELLRSGREGGGNHAPGYLWTQFDIGDRSWTLTNTSDGINQAAADDKPPYRKTLQQGASFLTLEPEANTSYRIYIINPAQLLEPRSPVDIVGDYVELAAKDLSAASTAQQETSVIEVTTDTRTGHLTAKFRTPSEVSYLTNAARLIAT